MRAFPSTVALLIFWSSAMLAQSSGPKPAAKPKPSTAATGPRPAAEPVLNTEDEKIIYALGLSIYQTLGQFDLSPAELEILKHAISDAAAQKPAIDLNEWGAKIQTLARVRSARVMERQKAESQAYLAKAAAEPGVIKTPSGLIYREIAPGTGPTPRVTDTVKVNYRGTLIDGTEFDSSYKRNEPAQFPLTGVIRCWTEGLQRMKVGGKSVLVCPSDLAYGDQGRPSIPPAATLIFEVELLAVPTATP
jgi:FKBP-type peptidyl-prolyl cis-trans isomerase FkpA